MASNASDSGFSLRRILMLVVPVALIAGAVLAYARWSGSGAFQTFDASDLVATEVRVMFRGEPLKDATLVTKTADGRAGGIGATDDDGMMRLMTDVGGGMIADGVLPGKHTISIVASLPGTGATPGPAFTPEQYRTVASTPIEIDFTATAPSRIEVVLTDDDTAMTPEAITEHLARVAGSGEAMARMAADRNPTNRQGAGETAGRPEGETPDDETPMEETPMEETPAGDGTEDETPTEETPAPVTPSGDGDN